MRFRHTASCSSEASRADLDTSTASGRLSRPNGRLRAPRQRSAGLGPTGHDGALPDQRRTGEAGDLDPAAPRRSRWMTGGRRRNPQSGRPAASTGPSERADHAALIFDVSAVAGVNQ